MILEDKSKLNIVKHKKSIANIKHLTQIDGKKSKFKEDIYNYYGIKKQSKHFKFIRKLLYPNDKKEFTSEVLSYLQPISIALWWMDDGCLSRRKLKNGQPGSYMLRLFTYTSKEETERIQKYFLDNYDVNWNVVKEMGLAWILTFPGCGLLGMIATFIFMRIF